MIKRYLKKLYGFGLLTINYYIPRLFYRSGFLSSLYYLLFSSSFHREHKSVLAGKIKHHKDSKNANYYLLVRNIHRLEKGLLMRPIRNIFGQDYLKETIDSFVGVWSKDDKSIPQLNWFCDVLNKYFSTVENNTFIKVQRSRFEACIIDYIAHDQQISKTPYIRDVASRSKITYDEFFELTRQRRSVRWFLNEPVPRELIDKAILAANQAPSACNRQPFEFRVIDDPNLLSEVVDLPMGTKGYGHSMPVMVVIVGNLDAYFDERDRHIIYVDASLANMSLMLALETLGLSSCAINWPDIEKREKKMEKFLNLDSHQRPIMCLGLGFPDPDGLVACSEKRSLNQIRKYN